MSRFCMLFLASATFLLGGCATETPKPTDPPRVSSMPWNHPERGEGDGGMGSMMNTR